MFPENRYPLFGIMLSSSLKRLLQLSVYCVQHKYIAGYVHQTDRVSPVIQSDDAAQYGLSPARHAHVALERGPPVAAVDDEVVPFRLAGDRFVDRRVERVV
jgi:hypothetical protein